jgi:hypothetical protein
LHLAFSELKVRIIAFGEYCPILPRIAVHGLTIGVCLMRPNITIIIPEPYIPLDEYCRRTGTNKETAKNLIEYGKLPIKPKGKQKNGLIEVNMAALTVWALNECNVSLQG